MLELESVQENINKNYFSQKRAVIKLIAENVHLKFEVNTKL
jgi:hypothetical protein